MIISNSTGSSQVYGEVAGGKYTISMGGGLYRTLAKELYSDIEGAIVRELSCNAVDIHNEIGQTKPYKITIKDGFFSIRDFGTGIPKKDIQKYATFGYSSKEESNDGIGGFGLGSKTPCAYTNNYTIRSYVDGTLYTYNVFGNDDDLSVMFASEESTDEANGLEILFEIKKDGEEQFIDRVNEICGWLSVPCELVTENGTEIVANKPLLDLNSGMFITGSSSGFRSWLICRVSMGGVHYSVPIEWLRSLSSKFYS